MKKIYTSVVLFTLSLVSFAQTTTLFQENFEYTASTILSDIPSSGWTIHSGTSYPIKTTSTSSLSFANYYGDGLGLAAVLDANGADSNKQFAEQSEGTPIYISFVVKVKAPIAGLIPPTSYFLHTSSLPFVSGSSSTFRGEIFAQPIANDLLQYNFGLSFSATTPQGTNTLNKLNYDQNYLVVLKYNSVIGANNDSVSLYVFSANDDFTTEPTQPLIGPLSLSSTSDIKPAAVCLRQYDGNEDILVDSIRVSTIWNLNSTLSTSNYFFSSAKIFPNPVKDGILYITGESSTNKSIEMYDLLGKKVFSSSKISDKVDIRSVKTGMYIARIKTEKGTAVQKIMVKNN